MSRCYANTYFSAWHMSARRGVRARVGRPRALVSCLMAMIEDAAANPASLGGAFRAKEVPQLDWYAKSPKHDHRPVTICALEKPTNSCLGNIPSWPARRPRQRSHWLRSLPMEDRPRRCRALPVQDGSSQADRPSASSQSVPPGHPSFRRQRASRACESESLLQVLRVSPRPGRGRGVISTLLTSLGTSVDCKTNANHHSQHVMRGK
jgi:hypothetical protein